MFKKEATSPRPLTQREQEILILLSEGLTHKEIGEKLSISHKTVSCHRASIKRKLQVSSLAELVRWAIQLELTFA